MDLSNNNINNNNNNNFSNNSKEELVPGLPETMIQSSKSPRRHQGKAKSEQFTGARGERRRKTSKPGKQQETNSQPASPILLASNSNTGGALHDALSGWSMEETSFSYSRKLKGGIGNIIEECREHVLGSAASNTTRELLDKKIDRDVVAVERRGGFGGDEQEQDSSSSSSRIKTVFARTSSPLYHRLARVDPIVDFFTVDEELMGRFRICSCLLPQQISRSANSGGSSAHAVTFSGGGTGSTGEGGIQQHAIIFKIKTTSPYSFWVRPIYGLMRPNVMAWVEVKCDLKANSLAKIELDMNEFLVEICPVPGALHTMTNDLYTSCVPSNLPELLSIWEGVERELKDNQQQLQGFIKEFHRITCRFQRSSLVSSVQSLVEADTTLQQLALFKKQQEKRDITMKDDISEKTENNNVKIYQWNPFSSPQAQPKASEDERYRLAREFPFHHHSGEGSCGEQCQSHHRKFGEKSTRCCCFPCCRCCGVFRKLCCLSFFLAFLLFAALTFIFYTQYYQYFSNNNDTSSYNDKNKNALVVSNNNKRYFHR